MSSALQLYSACVTSPEHPQLLHLINLFLLLLGLSIGDKESVNEDTVIGDSFKLQKNSKRHKNEIHCDSFVLFVSSDCELSTGKKEENQKEDNCSK